MVSAPVFASRKVLIRTVGQHGPSTADSATYYFSNGERGRTAEGSTLHIPFFCEQAGKSPL